MPMKLRPATKDDAATLRAWDSEPHVVASDPNDDWNWEEELGRDVFWRQQWVAEVEGEPIGFLQIIDPANEESQYWGTALPSGKRALDIWIGPAQWLGRGYGTRMMSAALEICFADPEVDEVLIDPLSDNERAIRFYRRLGFRFKEDRVFGKDRCSVHAITRSDWLRCRTTGEGGGPPLSDVSP